MTVKFRIASDFHPEMYSRDSGYRSTSFSNFLDVNEAFPILKGEEDQILLLAGDNGNLNYSFIATVNFYSKLCERFKAVVDVAGNHNFYGGSYKDFKKDKLVLKSDFPNLYYLNKETVDFEDVRVIATTLWTDFEMKDKKLMDVARQRMCDYKYVKDFTPEKSADIHLEELMFLDKELIKAKLQGVTKTIVLTHHLPSFQSVDEKYKGDLLNHAFASDCEWLLKKEEPNLWIHGHTHSSCDYKVLKTRVLCNPFGYDYGRENSKGFQTDLVVEL